MDNVNRKIPSPLPKNCLDKTSLQVLAEIVKITRSTGEGLDRQSYRARHGSELALLDNLERTGFLRKDLEKYWVSLHGLTLLSDRQSKALLGNCERLFSLLKKRYIADPRESIKVRDLAKLARMSFKKAAECLGYMVQVTWSGNRSTEFNDPKNAHIQSSETILRFQRFNDIVAEAIRLQTKQAQPANLGFGDLFTSPGSPLDTACSTILCRTDAPHVGGAWQKALERRNSDPEGAITAARTLLEAVCKFILDEEGVEYLDAIDLPNLYKLAVKQLSLAPSQHTEEAFKQTLGGCHGIVLGLSTLRNRLSDSHGKGKKGMKPAPRHAELAVNLAGALASFLIQTWEARKGL